MGKLFQILTELSAQELFSFLDDNLSKYQWIFTKLGMCIDIVDIWFEIANGQISSIFHKSYLPTTGLWRCIIILRFYLLWIQAIVL